MSNQQQTPLERLIAEKERIQIACELQEHKLNEDLSYIHDHAASLLLSGLSSLLFTGKKPTEKAGSTTAPVVSNAPAVSLGFADYLSLAKGMLPLAWDIIQPILLTWGIKKAKNWIYKLLFKKKA